jgi:nicotinate-nucleotide adenylyltransferase
MVARVTSQQCPLKANALPHLPAAGRWRGTRIGLLGGSFNPAHNGHLHITLEAIKRLRLDFVWWLVSPQNPLKPADGMAPFNERMAGALNMADHPRIMVTNIESRLGTRYSIDTIRALKTACPTTRFVWLMGADILHQFEKWKAWPEIVGALPIAVFARPGYSISALRGKMAGCYKGARRTPRKAKNLAGCSAAAWSYIDCPRHPASASDIRAANTTSQKPAAHI